jgi:hypothetical protein
MRIYSSKDVSDALAAGMELGGLVLAEADLSPSFFDLKSGLAGELFQRFVNYRVPLALIITDPAVHGERFNELALEHRSHPMVRIVVDGGEAAAWIAKA